MALLEITDLVAGYGSHQTVLQGISLSVAEGEFVAVLGANGAGKSTLLRTLSGQTSIQGGSMRFAGSDITRAAPRAIVRAGVVHVPEGRQIFPDLTVRENLMVGAYTLSRSQASESYDRTLETIPLLAEHGARRAGLLSGGQQQMVAIGRALMARPRLLILDEPTLGLSPKAIEQVEELVVALNSGGLTVIAVEQNVHIALRNADRGVVVENGELVVEGTAEELWQNEGVIRAYLGV